MHTRQFHFDRIAIAVVAIVAGAVVIASGVAAGDLLVEETLPLSLARQAAESAVLDCERRGYRVSAAVAGRDGLVKVLLRGDGAGPHTLDSSSRKAYTALTLRRATSDLVKLIQEHPDAAGLRDMNERILILGGGLPIESGGEVIGGIGVGGAPGGQFDEACARAGIEAIGHGLR